MRAAVSAVYSNKSTPQFLVNRRPVALPVSSAAIYSFPLQKYMLFTNNIDTLQAQVEKNSIAILANYVDGVSFHICDTVIELESYNIIGPALEKNKAYLCIINPNRTVYTVPMQNTKKDIEGEWNQICEYLSNETNAPLFRE